MGGNNLIGKWIYKRNCEWKQPKILTVNSFNYSTGDVHTDHGEYDYNFLLYHFVPATPLLLALYKVRLNEV